MTDSKQRNNVLRDLITHLGDILGAMWTMEMFLEAGRPHSSGNRPSMVTADLERSGDSGCVWGRSGDSRDLEWSQEFLHLDGGRATAWGQEGGAAWVP